MSKRLSASPLLAVLAFTTACSSDGRVERPGPVSAGTTGMGPGPSPSTVPEDPTCVEGLDGLQVCAPNELPFATFVLAVSDACMGPDDPCATGAEPVPGETTAQLTRREAGKVCLDGVLAPSGWGQLIVGFSEVDVEVGKVLRKFDAQGLGITQVAFTVDSPPRGGVGVDGAVNTVLSCPEDAFDCMTWGFNLMDGPNSSSPLNITTSRRVTAPFTHFKQTRPPPVSQTFDTSALEHLSFGVGGGGAYDFCVSDLQFLDAAGQVVQPK